MEHRLALEIFGYCASALIATSLMMSSLLRLRLINLAGASMFATYGLLIHAYPVAILNGIIVSVNVYHLSRLLRARKLFQLLPLKPESVYLPYFLEFYAGEIRRILPEFKYQPSPDQFALFVLCDCSPVGVFIANQNQNGVLNVVLDFVIPGYRDTKMGRFLFSDQADFFRQRGVKEVVITPRTKEFGGYLMKVGFEPVHQKPGAYRICFDAPAQKPG